MAATTANQIAKHPVSPAQETRTTLRLPGELTATGLVLKSGLSYESWEAAGTMLRTIDGGVQWWLGDWLNYGEAAYGEKYSQALSETDYAYQTLMNAAYVSSRFDISRRRENLSFSHHADVAALEPALQDKWLAHAEQHKLSQKAFRAALREARLAPTVSSDGDLQQLNIRVSKSLIEKIKRIATESGESLQGFISREMDTLFSGRNLQQGLVSDADLERVFCTWFARKYDVTEVSALNEVGIFRSCSILEAVGRILHACVMNAYYPE